MDDGKTSDIKTGKGKTDLASDEFYWQDYFLTPKDYAVEAFKLARQYGNPDNKLFINDYNLEYNLNKCDGLIKYVEYIESKGATVDGIGTQMHIAIDSNKDNIAQMFQKLGATRRLLLKIWHNRQKCISMSLICTRSISQRTNNMVLPSGEYRTMKKNM